tara:strand:- start:24 stop:191 length:168 start_codon:yes stop_codon:yes gene_type:complete
MNLIAGLQFILILFTFGTINYFLMLRRYEKDVKKNKNLQLKKIAELYPKGTFIST